jgi:hypothetical protein
MRKEVVIVMALLSTFPGDIIRQRRECVDPGFSRGTLDASDLAGNNKWAR